MAAFVVFSLGNTNSSLHDLICTSLVAVSFQSCAMRSTNSSLLWLIGPPLMTASFHLCSMRDTNSSLLGSIGGTFKAARLPLCSVCDTNSSLVYLVGALTFAPWVVQTPPLMTWLVHPSKLHLFTFAHEWHKLLPFEQSWYILHDCIVYTSLRSMRDTNSSLHDMIGISL
jgi:hypothetical protein